MVLFHCFFTYFLCFKVVRNMMKYIWHGKHYFVVHFSDDFKQASHFIYTLRPRQGLIFVAIFTNFILRFFAKI